MLFKDPLSVLSSLTLIYEDLDVDNVEEKLVELVHEAFGFDRVALFFVKHKKGVLQGKLSRGCGSEVIKNTTVPLEEQNILTTPLLTGVPLWGAQVGDDDLVAAKLGMTNYVIVPIVNKKRVNCWDMKKCENRDCRVYGKKLVRCWLTPGTACYEGSCRPDVCEVFTNHNLDAMEGVLVADNTPSGNLIKREAVTALSIIAHAVGQAINNSKSYQKAVSESVRDPLTGLHNRRFFNEHLMDEVDRSNRYGDPFGLIICDIDKFKLVNDRYGHPLGDVVLDWVAQKLLANCRRTDVVARYGGEEFAILLTNTAKDEAQKVAEAIRAAFDGSHFEHDGLKLHITLSFGLAGFPSDASSFQILVTQADKALYSAKRHGRNRVITL